MTQSQLEFQYNKAYHVLKTIDKLQNEYNDLKAEYEKAVVIRSKDIREEYVGIISEAFPEDRVTSRSGLIRITFKDPNQGRNHPAILAKIPKVNGKQPMKGHSYSEEGWVDLEFTTQFLKSTLNIFQLPNVLLADALGNRVV